MAHERKIKCDCGRFLEEKETRIEHIITGALVCPNCGFTTLTKEQAKMFQKRLELHNAVDQEKQIIKIGNSMGITLPEKLRDFGIKIGNKVKLEAINERSFKVELG
ncbi:AbrB/MazE/SpoVT family DNA-binding domain-containing protein [Candidatus Woesearchaeota archaeon]|nr:AbrB/MazE/SpoVT family DNA-binding domain-containing protein [Candidatus Woesearchaeota archaeon]